MTLQKKDFRIKNPLTLEGIDRPTIYLYTESTNIVNPSPPAPLDEGDIIMVVDSNGSGAGDWFTFMNGTIGGGGDDGRFHLFLTPPSQSDLNNLANNVFVLGFENGTDSLLVDFGTSGGFGNPLDEIDFSEFAGIKQFVNGEWVFQPEFRNVLLTEAQQTEDVAPNASGVRTLAVSVEDEGGYLPTSLIYAPDFEAEKAPLLTEATHEFKFKNLDESNFPVRPVLYLDFEIEDPGAFDFLGVSFVQNEGDAERLGWVAAFLRDGTSGEITFNELLPSDNLRTNEWNHVRVTLLEREGEAFLVLESFDYEQQQWSRDAAINLSEELPTEIAEGLLNEEKPYGFGLDCQDTLESFDGLLLDDYLVTEVNLGAPWE